MGKRKRFRRGLMRLALRRWGAVQLLQEYVNAADNPRTAIDVTASDEWRYHWLCRVRDYLREVSDGR